MNKITETIYGSKIPLNERGILNTPLPSVKGKAGTTTQSTVAVSYTHLDVYKRQQGSHTAAEKIGKNLLYAFYGLERSGT